MLTFLNSVKSNGSAEQLNVPQEYTAATVTSHTTLIIYVSITNEAAVHNMHKCTTDTRNHNKWKPVKNAN